MKAVYSPYDASVFTTPLPDVPRMENGAGPRSPPVNSLPIISSLLEHAAAKAAASTNIE
jgi:hypothetical protein